jgi:hypothetical protein
MRRLRDLGWETRDLGTRYLDGELECYKEFNKILYQPTMLSDTSKQMVSLDHSLSYNSFYKSGSVSILDWRLFL